MSELDQSALKARNNLLALFLVYIILDTLLVVVAKDIWAIGRILVTIFVMYFTLQPEFDVSKSNKFLKNKGAS